MPFRRLLLPCALLLVAAAPAATAATPVAVTSEELLARDVAGDIDGIVEPGDTVEIIQRLRSTSAGTVTGLAGTLLAPGATVTSAFTGFPDVAPGAVTANTATPYRLAIPGSLVCGGSVDLTIQLRDGAGNNSIVSTPLVTGIPGLPQSYGTSTPVTVPADGTEVTSTISVPPMSGSVGAASVTIDGLSHPSVRDLKVQLTSPGAGGRTITLVPAAPGAPGTAFTGTTFVADGPLLSSGSSPWTGTFGAEELPDMGGAALSGDWRLSVRTTVTSGTATGTLSGWTLELRPATCDPVLTARITRSPLVGVPGQNVTLDASTSIKPMANPAPAYRWDINADGTWDTTGTTATVTRATAGFVPVRLEMNQGGTIDTEELLIPFSRPPVAAITNPGDELSGTDLTFSAAGTTDPDGDSIVEYRWDPENDGSFQISTGADPVLTHAYATPGSKVMAVEVMDGYGAKGVTSVGFSVVNRAPVGALTAPAWAVHGEAFTLDASGSADPDGTISEYGWDLDGDGFCDDATTTTATRSLTLTAALTVGVCPKDNLNNVGTIATRTINVTRRPLAVIAAPATVKPHAAASLSGTGSSDPDGDAITDHAWDLDNDGIFETSGATASKAWPTEGSRTVGLRVTDTRGITGTAQTLVSVVNAAPLPGLVLTPATANVGVPITFDARGSVDPDGSIVAWDMDLDGDGSYETRADGGVAARAYPNAGALSVGVRVTDSDGKTAATRRDLLITRPATVISDAGGGRSPLPPPPAPAPPAPRTPSAGGDAGDEPLVALTAIPIQRWKTVLRRGVLLRCAGDRSIRCSVRATVDRRTARRLGLAKHPKGSTTVGKRTLRGGRSLRMRLTTRTRSRLRRSTTRSVLITVRGTARDADGNTRRIVRSVLLRR